jgi:hypothetical protein
MAKSSPFGRPCPHKDCNKKIVRATGDLDGDECSVRCEVGHYSRATRDGRGLTVKLPKD